MTNLIPAVQLIDGHPRVSSLSISEHFEKPHDAVLKSVRKIVSECPAEFDAVNFYAVNYTDAKGESRPMYQLSRDGFTLVAMGFTGKKALAWKVRYIEAFNAMERALIEGAHGEPVSIPPTASTAADRAPLRSLVHAWAQVAGQPHQALWPQVKAHFQLSRIDDLPVEWIPDALAFVQSKIDALPKALPEAKPAPVPALKCPMHDFDQASSVAGDISSKAFAAGMNFYNQLKAWADESKDSFSHAKRVSNVMDEFDHLVSIQHDAMRHTAHLVFEACASFSAQNSALARLAVFMYRQEKMRH